ncbi:MAG: SAM-dependent methyltransferase, partial [Alistipes sp.]|nr:SAM-dependent methyltransferase [Alistipes sp.]
CRELPQRTLLGRVDEIAEIEEYRPKALRRRYAGVGVEVLKRDCRLSVDAIRRAAALRPGADVRIAFTDIGGKTWAIRLK